MDTESEAEACFDVLKRNKPDELGYNALVKKPGQSISSVGDEWAVFVSDQMNQTFAADESVWQEFADSIRQEGYSVELNSTGTSMTVW